LNKNADTREEGNNYVFPKIPLQLRFLIKYVPFILSASHHPGTSAHQHYRGPLSPSPVD
jgi:hypothetical protein